VELSENSDDETCDNDSCSDAQDVVTYKQNVWPFDTPKVLWWLSNIHTCLCLIMLIGFYNLKVPLIIFKREKDISRSMEFDGLYAEENPSEDDISGQWDRLVISSPTFPRHYWDKYVKQKVFKKYSDVNNADKLSKLLGIVDPEAHSSFKDSDTQVAISQYFGGY